MSIQRVEMAGLTTHIVDRVSPHTRGTPITAILLHGFGAPGDDLVGLAHALDRAQHSFSGSAAHPGKAGAGDLPPHSLSGSAAHPGKAGAGDAPVRFVFPEGRLRLGGMYGDARAWWPLDLAVLEARLLAGASRAVTDEVPDGLPESRALVAQLVEEVATRFSTTTDRIVLGGFSQGAMLSLDVALHSTSALAGVVVLSGTLVAGAEWIPRLPNLANQPVFQSHGRQDPLLPFALAELLRDELIQGGARVEWHPFDGGHTIPPRVLGELAAFLRKLS